MQVTCVRIFFDLYYLCIYCIYYNTFINIFFIFLCPLGEIGYRV